MSLPDLPYGVVAWDVETRAFTDEDKIPEIVCATFSGGEESAHLAEAIAGVCEAQFAWVTRMFVSRRFGPMEHRYWTLIVKGEQASLEALRVFAYEATAPDGTLRWKIVSQYGVFDHTCVLRAAGHDVRDPHADPGPARELFGWLDKNILSFVDIREKLICIAKDWFNMDPRLGVKTKWSLAHFVAARWGEDISASKKDPDAWRLRYAELIPVPLMSWPPAAVDYALDDAVWARMVYLDQARPLELPEGPVVYGPGMLFRTPERLVGEVVGERFETPFAVTLSWMGVVGPMVDAAAVYDFAADMEQAVTQSLGIAQELGFWRYNNCKNCEGTGLVGTVPVLTQCPVCLGQGKPRKKPGRYMARLHEWVTYHCDGCPPMTPKSKRFPNGQVKADRDVLVSLGNERLAEYAEAGVYRTNLERYVPMLLAAAGNSRLTSRPNPLVRSRRTSWSEPNLQVPPKKGRFRECFIARPGMVWASIDYDFIELCTLAQTCLDMFGYSHLADAINSGKDPHLYFVSQMLGISYEEALARYRAGDPVVAQARDEAKAANFGFPGGMGIENFLKTFGGAIQDTPTKSREQRASELKEDWFNAYPEIREYFRYIGDMTPYTPPGEPKKRFALWQPGAPDGRGAGVRGGCSFTSAANTFFQGRTAVGIKAATTRLAREAHCGGPGHPLWGVRSMIMIHDEWLGEGPRDRAHIWAPYAAQVMREEMSSVVPDVKIGAEPALMLRWHKGAKPVYDAAGNLTVWEPTP